MKSNTIILISLLVVNLIAGCSKSETDIQNISDTIFIGVSEKSKKATPKNGKIIDGINPYNVTDAKEQHYSDFVDFNNVIQNNNSNIESFINSNFNNNAGSYPEDKIQKLIINSQMSYRLHFMIDSLNLISDSYVSMRKLSGEINFCDKHHIEIFCIISEDKNTIAIKYIAQDKTNTEYIVTLKKEDKWKITKIDHEFTEGLITVLLMIMK